MKKPFYVTITETYSRSIGIAAEDICEAEEKAAELCNCGAINLDNNDFVSRNFSSEEAAPVNTDRLEMFVGTEPAEQEEEPHPSMFYVDAKNLVDTAIKYGILRTEECVAIYRAAGKDPVRNPEGWYLEPKEDVYQTIMRDKEGQRTLIDTLEEKGILFRSGTMPLPGTIAHIEIAPEDLSQNADGYGHINLHANGSIYTETHVRETAKEVELLSKAQKSSLEFMRDYLLEQQDESIKQLKTQLASMISQQSMLCSVYETLEKKTQEEDKSKKEINIVRIGFVNPETENEDETEFDTGDMGEALRLFRKDFCNDNGWDKCPEIIYIEKGKELVEED